MGTFGFSGLGADTWAADTKTDWYLDEIEVYQVRRWRTNRGLFQHAPGGSGSSGDKSVHIWYRNVNSGIYSPNAWGVLKRITLPSFVDDFMYGFSVALDINTLVVGRGGNRDVYVHDRHSSDCVTSGDTDLGPYCGDRGTFSAHNWGLVQSIHWPGSNYRDPDGTAVYGGLWQETFCGSRSGCTTQTVPSVTPLEWGCSVDVSGKYLIVGAYKSSAAPASATATGAAFMYQRNTAGDFVYKTSLLPSTTTNQHCGNSIRHVMNGSAVHCCVYLHA